MFGETGIKDGVAVWLWGAVFKSAGESGEEVGRFIEEGFGALGDEVGCGRRGVCEDCGERYDGFGGDG